MIPQKIQALFDFIDFLDKIKNEYIEKYIPLCDELRGLDEERGALKPKENYKEKHAFDEIQKEITEKFVPITENIYQPFTSKLLELGIWSGDDVFTSIWNNNISEIEDFKRHFIEDDIEKVFHYKKKYLTFRTETNNDFLCLSFILSNLDDIFRVLFDFFKDTQENEFDGFETKIIEFVNPEGVARSLQDNIRKNVRYSIPSDTFFNHNEKKSTTSLESKNEFNFYAMRDKIEIGNISNNKGQINVGKDNRIEVDGGDEIAKKSFKWQKKDTIIMIAIGIIGIVISYLSLVK
ncbi:hypothetical protein [Pedobacter rhizosphaerae]|uniref:Uncharacterized protein n=1 Tax=Pedobacter rhizosphaerae TaxID=390241 RepID=A0A1H9UB03_9SPHI|nr:hypothetical protein [Pedobacter rhizosphaerae]SES06626.1 hypothetical protein SAMN04488023_12922 [Pedobacter rhizosphaerae]